MTEAERELLMILAKLVMPHPADREPDLRNPISVLRWRAKELLEQMHFDHGA